MSRLPGLPRGAVVLKVEQDLCRLPSYLVGYRQFRIPTAYPAGPPSQPSFVSVPYIGCPTQVFTHAQRTTLGPAQHPKMKSNVYGKVSVQPHALYSRYISGLGELQEI
jgi:hypothetical protein